MSVAGLLALLKGIVDIIIAIPNWISAWVKSRVDATADKRDKDIEEAVKKAKNAKTIQEKADAACEIEKSINPDSTCSK